MLGVSPVRNPDDDYYKTLAFTIFNLDSSKKFMHLIMEFRDSQGTEVFEYWLQIPRF